ncbi:MAG: ABC transporter permease [Pyramidobacter sp.]|nr:ABC transporter permease [Pyramidobacter sp.]
MKKPHIPEQAFQQVLLLGVLAFLIAALALSSEFFLTWRNWRNIMDHMSTQMLLSIGMTFVIASGGIDLSVGGALALSGVLMGMTMKAGLAALPAILLGLTAAALMGALNGYCVSRISVTPFIVTLGTASVYRGAAIILTKGTPIYTMPPEFTWWGKGGGTALNPPILIMLCVLCAAFVILRSTRWGQYALSLGSCPEALKRLGVRVTAYRTSVYVFSGLMAGLSALIITARLNTAEPTAGVQMELDAVTAVVMGGSFMQGGRATITGTAIACVLLAVIRNGLTMLNINAHYQQFITGILLLVSVAVTEKRRSLSNKKLKSGEKGK